jgi:hypothetical protein
MMLGVVLHARGSDTAIACAGLLEQLEVAWIAKQVEIKAGWRVDAFIYVFNGGPSNKLLTQVAWHVPPHPFLLLSLLLPFFLLSSLSSSSLLLPSSNS